MDNNDQYFSKQETIFLTKNGTNKLKLLLIN